MTPEEQKRADAAAKKRAYRQRKRSEKLARQAPPEELTTMFNEQARNITPELEEQWKNAKRNSELRPLHTGANYPPGVLYQDHREQAQAIVSDAEERHRRVELIMANYKRDAANGNALLWHILETLTLMRIEMVDLLGGKK